jgi:hypothetical protein
MTVGAEGAGVLEATGAEAAPAAAAAERDGSDAERAGPAAAGFDDFESVDTSI